MIGDHQTDTAPAVEGPQADEQVLRLDRHLWFIAAVLYAVGVTLLLPLANSNVYGGEEFATPMFGAGLGSAGALFERVRSGVAESSEEVFGSRVRTSAGAVGTAELEEESIPAAADEAMYEAKRRGKDRLFIPEVPGGGR